MKIRMKSMKSIAIRPLAISPIAIKPIIIKSIATLFVLLALASCVSYQVDDTPELSTNFEHARHILNYHGFVEQEPTLYNKSLGIYKHVFVFENNKEKDYSVIFYMNGDGSGIKYIEIKKSSFGLDTTGLDTTSLDKGDAIVGQLSPQDRHLLYKNDFIKLQNQTSFLNCSNDATFLSLDFNCDQNYKVTSSVKRSLGLDNILFLSKRSKKYYVTITIKPLVP